jgi:hypothetical protein
MPGRELVMDAQTLSKAYEPSGVEEKWYAFWIEGVKEVISEQIHIQPNRSTPLSSHRRM